MSKQLLSLCLCTTLFGTSELVLANPALANTALTNAKTALSANAQLSELTIANAQQQMQQGKLSAEQLTQYYLVQIQQKNHHGPNLRAFNDMNRDALKLAKRLDAERKAGKVRGPLHGIPVALKANIASNDGLPTTAGALALKGFLTKQDAQLVQQLRDAGAIIIGKTNLSEWANFRGNGSASGWSALGGQTKNPYVLYRTPCGSSSGSAVAVAADLTLVAVGTETDGSITCPAAINNVVGIKPTSGAISGAGIIPIANSQDTAGPITRTVADAEILLDALATAQAKQFYKLGGSAERKIKSVVLIRQYDLEYPAVRHMLDQIEQKLKAQGITVQSSKKFELDEQAGKDEFAVLLYEYKRDLNQWLLDYQAPNAVDTIAKIFAFNQSKGKKALAFYGQEFFAQAKAIDLETQKSAYHQARSRNLAAAKGLIDAELARADLIIAPAYGPAWPIDHVKGDQFNFGTSSPAAISGYPSLTMPAGFDGELPLGISLIGAPWSEPMLIKFAKSIEQPRVSPKYLPTLPEMTSPDTALPENR